MRNASKHSPHRHPRFDICKAGFRTSKGPWPVCDTFPGSSSQWRVCRALSFVTVAGAVPEFNRLPNSPPTLTEHAAPYIAQPSPEVRANFPHRDILKAKNDMRIFVGGEEIACASFLMAKTQTTDVGGGHRPLSNQSQWVAGPKKKRRMKIYILTWITAQPQYGDALVPATHIAG